MRFDVNNGTATMNISFSDGCSLMTLRFQCVGGVMDTLSLCSGRATRTAPFEVVGPPGDALEGNPVWLRLPIGRTLTHSAFERYVSFTFNPQAMSTALMALLSARIQIVSDVVTEFICGSDVALGGFNEAMMSDPAICLPVGRNVSTAANDTAVPAGASGSNA
eukprot:Rhum_TRINITY_DN23942_c0_g1::Rhum_TRINITY_DN23942_c0_g1_i1::g.179011::m.179011